MTWHSTGSQKKGLRLGVKRWDEHQRVSGGSLQGPWQRVTTMGSWTLWGPWWRAVTGSKSPPRAVAVAGGTVLVWPVRETWAWTLPGLGPKLERGLCWRRGVGMDVAWVQGLGVDMAWTHNVDLHLAWTCMDIHGPDFDGAWTVDIGLGLAWA